MDSTGWNSQDHGMHPGADDDFQQFLDMNGIANMTEGLQFDFHDFQSPNNAHMIQAPPRGPIDTPMSGTDAPVMLSRMDPGMHNQMPAMTSAPSHPPLSASMIPPSPIDTITEIDAQIQYLQQQKLQQQQRQLEEQQAAYFVRQSRMVPPTPQSLELQAGNNQYYTQPDQTPQQHAMYDHFQRMKDQHDMSFTPLVSPAVTPLESHFPIDTQFTVPGAYFSPLTSPALHAQNETMSVFDQRLSSANTSSPGEMDLEAMPPAPAPVPTSGDLSKKARKNNAAKSRSKGKVGQSPISKPQRRKTTTTPIMNAQALTELAETAELGHEQLPEQAMDHQHFPQPAGTTPSSSMATTDSENASVSPENLSDMPPPPLPKSRSAKPSPYIQPQADAVHAGSHVPHPGKPSPATPASLMKLASPNAGKIAATGGSDSGAAEHIENFELPESVNAANFPKSQLTPLNTQSPRIQTSPALDPSSAKAASFQPLPSPVFAKPTGTASATQSPQLAPGSSSSTPNPRKTPQLAPRGGSKRASISSVHVSPALRPRISPNIKPLLPGGATAEDAASRLLATKSNYQNILEGNNVPGVSYPSELSTNLTSKRTSHKIAEQGRRNRINSALQEIATLLPKAVIEESKVSEGESGDKKDKGANGPNSKASTVEMAIEYIKQLRQEVAEANRRAEEAEKKLGLKADT
ncbi:Phosphorus acquisition-controlling protein [Pleurostoma richardsiae]|uniref:Phosphorus acquisition-controlling protein n=1 Tax=Pleurostoma richardsiae TaxID=41990 RepID=A0AA38RUT3_9PEZI|nr:Phosphorus acquisition-controlling protein [Pleurostoma richardsiae]